MLIFVPVSGYTSFDIEKKKPNPGKKARRRLKARKEALKENLKKAGLENITIYNRDVNGKDNFLQNVLKDFNNVDSYQRKPKKLKIIADEIVIPPLKLKIIKPGDTESSDQFWQIVRDKLPDSSNRLKFEKASSNSNNPIILD